MRRTVWLSVVLPLVMGLVGAVVGQAVMLPALVAAQDPRLRAERVTVVGDNGAERIDLANGPGLNSAVQVNDSNGVRRAGFNNGGLLSGNDPDGSGFNVWAADGTTPLVRLGTGRGPSGNGPLRNVLFLTDQQGQMRIRLIVDENGLPSIEMLDATGNVTWRAQ
jgi:hypothetical protein